jgi:hypothetical protein
VQYLDVTQRASDHGYVAAFLVVSALALIGVVTSAWLVRRPPDAAGVAEQEVPEAARGEGEREDEAPTRHPVRPARLASSRARGTVTRS